jgi:hypothetical protein
MVYQSSPDGNDGDTYDTFDVQGYVELFVKAEIASQSKLNLNSESHLSNDDFVQESKIFLKRKHTMSLEVDIPSFLNDKKQKKEISISTKNDEIEKPNLKPFLNGNLNGAANSATNAQDVFAMIVDQFDATGSLIIRNTVYNVSTGADNGGPRSTPTQLWSQVFTSQSQDTRLIHFPAGPQNLENSVGLEAGLAYYTVTFCEQFAGTSSVNLDGVYGSYRFDIVDAKPIYD